MGCCFKSEKDFKITNAFQKILNEFNHKPQKKHG